MPVKLSFAKLLTRIFLYWNSFVLLASSPACFSAENLWSVLKKEGSALDIMALDSFAGEFAIVGVQYVEVPWASQGEIELAPLVPPVVRKQLYILRVAENDTIVWRNSYPTLPDALEIFSIAATSDNRLCVVFGEQRGQEAILNPVLLQVDGAGKVLWAKRNIISSLEANIDKSEPIEQIANLDTLHVLASSNNGCVITFVTRQFSKDVEKFQLLFVQYAPDGNVQWRQSTATEMYGKLFFIHNSAANNYVVIQTNQSRDAAIEAMMLAVPFVPKTALVGIGYKGDISYQFANPDSLANVWVKDVYDSAGDAFLIAGKTKSAWAGQLNSSGKVLKFVDALEGEFTAVAGANSDDYLFARGDSLTLSENDLTTYSNQKIKDVITHQYANQYLMARLPDDMPVEQMIALGNHEYMILYKLGSKLVKVSLTKAGK